MDGKNRTNFFFHDRKPQITHVQGGIVGQAEAVLSFPCAGVTRQADLLPGVYAHALIIHIQAAALEQHGKLASLCKAHYCFVANMQRIRPVQCQIHPVGNTNAAQIDAYSLAALLCLRNSRGRARVGEPAGQVQGQHQQYRHGDYPL